MALDGECIKDLFELIPKQRRIPSNPPLPPARVTCCGLCAYKPLASSTDTDYFKNDINGFTFYFENDVTNAAYVLQKWNSATGLFQNIENITDNSFGVYSPFGFFTNVENQTFIDLQLSWHDVIVAHGAGSYKIRIDVASILGNYTMLSDEYCLHEYSPRIANGTVRIEYYDSGIFGINNDDLGKRDYDTMSVYNSLRLRGVFSFKKAAYSEDYTLYDNGERVWTKDEQEPEFELELRPICWNFHELIRTDVLQADRILITDYNKENFATWVQKSVQKTSEYAPNFFINQSKLASVKLTFRQSANNLQKLRY